MKVFIISIVTLFFTAMFLLTIRFWGLGQSSLPFETRFLENKPALFFIPTSLENLNELHQKYPLAGFYFETQFENDRLFIFKTPIQDILKPLSGVKKIVVVNHDSQNSHTVTISELRFLDAKNIKDELLFTSDYALLTENVKKEFPLWTYGSSRAEILKLNSFLSLWIGPASPVKSDIYISPYTIRNRNVVNKELIEELQRRKKPIIIGPIENQEQALRLKSWNIDGYILKNEESLSWLQ